MQFSVGDAVVHPHHGAGRITSLERKELLDGNKMYFEIEILAQDLSVYLPKRTIEDMGVRPAMSRSRFPRVLDKLRSQPRILPNDYKERQEKVWEQLKTGLVMQLAEAVRDLAWHEKREHLTKKDTAYLAQGKSRLAAEMAIVSGQELSDMETLIDDTLSAAVSRRAERERRHQRLTEVTDLPNRGK